MRLITFAAATNMRISSTYFQRKNIHKATWNPPGGGKKCQIDHLLIDSRHASNIMNVRSYRYSQLDIDHHDSDHFAIGAEIRFRISNVGRIRSTKAPKYDVEKLKSEKVKEEFNATTEAKLASLDRENITWQNCHDAMKDAAVKCIGYSQPGKKEWFDEECKNVVQNIIDARKKRSTRAREEEIRKLQKDKKMLLRKKRENMIDDALRNLRNIDH